MSWGGAKNPAKSFGKEGLSNVHPVMKTHTGHVLVRHPALPGQHMLAANPDYAELPTGSQSKHSPAGGIVGGLAPFQSEMGATAGDYSNG